MRTLYITILSLSILTLVSCDTAVNSYSITDHFVACGWMGCGASSAETITFDEHWDERPHSGNDCIKVAFEKCNDGGTGVYWVNAQGPEGCNWGDIPGNNYSTDGYTKVTFWARGEKGGERIKFGFGGIKSSSKLYKDSAEVFQFASLKKGWKKYTLDIRDQNLHSVIGGFFWYATFEDNPEGGTFYIDDIQLQ